MRNIILKSERFNLFEFSPEDAGGLLQLNDDPDVLNFTGDPPFENINSAREFIHNYNHYRKHGFGRWTILDKHDNSFIGWCGLKYSPELDEVDIGFRILKSQRNRGIATETGLAALEYGFTKLKLHRIVARVIDSNTGSLKVISKLEMQPCGNFIDKTGNWVLFEKFNA